MYVASTASSSVEVLRLSSLGGDEPLRAAWNALAAGIPFRRWEWLDSWWRSYGATDGRRRELLLLGVLADGHLVGGAPWYCEESAAHGRVLRFLGDGEACSDYLGFPCLAGWETTVAQALAVALVGSHATAGDCTAPSVAAWDLAEFSSISEPDAVARVLLDQLAAQGCLVHGRPGPACWRIDLPATWPQYLAQLSRSHRKQLLRIQRRYFDSGRATLRTATTEEDVDRGLRILAELHQRRWEVVNQPGCFALPRFAGFLFDVAHQQWRTGHLQLHWLECDGGPIAAEYHLLDGHVVYAYQSGIDPRALQHEPGRLITMALLRKAIEEGRAAFDFLRGDEAYKAHWRAQPRPAMAYRVLPSHGRSRLRQSLWLAGDQVKQWLKAGLRWNEPAVSQAAGRAAAPS